MKTIIFLLITLLASYSQAEEKNKYVEIDNVSTKGLDKDVARVFKSTRQLIEKSRKDKDRETEMRASKKWCLLLHNFNFLTQAASCYYIIGLADKTNEQWPYLYAKVSAEKGDFEEAGIGFKEAVRRNPNYLPAHFYLIQQALDDNQLLTAFQLHSQVPIELQFTSSMLNQTGDMFFATQNHFISIGYYQQALKLVPDAKSLYYKIAQNYQAMDLMEKAQENISLMNNTKVRLVDPFYQEVKNMNVGEIPFLIKAKTALVNGDVKAAIKNYKKALKYNANSESALVNIAVAYYQNNQLELAKETFGQVLQINPNQTKALYNLGTLALIEKDYPTAMAHYEKFVSLDLTDTSVNLQLASLYYQQKSFDKVIMLAQVDGMQTNVEMQFLKSKVLIQQQKFDEAIHWLTEINKHKPGNYKVLMALARIYAQVPDINLRDKVKALDFAQQAIQVEENAQSYWQLIIALDENEHCDKLNVNLLQISELLKIEVQEGYKNLAQQRGKDLNCILNAQ